MGAPYTDSTNGKAKRFKKIRPIHWLYVEIQNMSNIKIFLSYHKPSVILKNEIFQPIHVGRALQKQDKDSWTFQNLVGDDTGDNISERNPNYCELTAQYWAWKNAIRGVDYVGFMHYRRHLSFNLHKKYRSNQWGLIHRKSLDDAYIKDFGLTPDTIKSVVEKYDIVTVEPWDVRNAGTKNTYDHYASSDPKLHIQDYELALNILREKYPEYTDTIEKYNRSTHGYFTNIFVMKTEIFNDYCQWLFDILFEVEKQSDISKYDFQEARIYGYISEWLFGIYITHLKETKKYKIKELQRTFVEDTDIHEPMNICFASDNNYAKYMGVAISSILRHKDKADKINIYVLDGGISDKRKREIAKLSKIAPFNIKYLKVKTDDFAKLPMGKTKHLTPAAYYRLTMDTQIQDLDKVLYLDSDLLVKQSLWGLYNTDLDDNYIAGILDILNYSNTERLHLDKYVNSGVLLMNLAKWRKDNIQDKFFKYIKDNEDDEDKILWHDQDVINVVCQGHIKYVDDKWNVQLIEDIAGRSEHFKKILKQANIVHFISAKKPWLGRGGKYDKYYYDAIIHTPWVFDYYKYILGLCKKSLKAFVKFLFQLTNTHWQSYKDISILGLHFYPRKRPGAPSLFKYRLRFNLIRLIPVHTWRIISVERFSKHIYDTAWYLYSDGFDRKIVADFCRFWDNESIYKTINCHFYLVYMSAVAEMGYCEQASIIYDKYSEKYGLHDLFRFIPTVYLAEYLKINDQDIDKTKYVFEKMRQNTGAFAKLVKNKSVAVVGNAPCQLGKGTGKEIDSADIVIRFNNFSTDGYKDDYGEKTDVWVWGCGAGELGKKESDLAKNVKIMMWGPDWEHFFVSGNYHEFLYDLLSDEKVKTTFEFFPKENFMSLRSEIPLKFNEHPALGTTAVYYLLKYCKPKSVKYYGFSFLTNDSGKGFTHYYEQGNENRPHPHDLDAESRFLKKLTQKDEK